MVASVMEFYRSGEKIPFRCRYSLQHTPSTGDEIDVAGVRGTVSMVAWNLDYEGETYEQWRCSVYIKPFTGR